MTREEIIQQLVLDRLEYAGDHRRYLWLQEALENGFCGFANMTDRDLAAEAGVFPVRQTPDTVESDIDNDVEAYTETDEDEDVYLLVRDYAGDLALKDIS